MTEKTKIEKLEADIFMVDGCAFSDHPTNVALNGVIEAARAHLQTLKSGVEIVTTGDSYVEGQGIIPHDKSAALEAWDYLLGEISANGLILHDGTLDKLNALIRYPATGIRAALSETAFERTVVPKGELQKLAIQNFTETHHKISEDHLHAIGWVVNMLDYNGAFDGPTIENTPEFRDMLSNVRFGVPGRVTFVPHNKEETLKPWILLLDEIIKAMEDAGWQHPELRKDYELNGICAARNLRSQLIALLDNSASGE